MTIVDRPRVLIADDHTATRMGVRMALEADGCSVCAEAANAGDAVRAAVAEQPDICLVDLGMPGDGLRAVAGIVAALPETPVLVLTVSRSSDDLLDALRAGASGYLLKDMDPAQLSASVRATLDGEAPLPGFMTARLIEELRFRGAHRSVIVDHRRIELTPREWDVLELLSAGRSTAEIAARLRLSQVTVRRHVSMLQRRLGVSTREEAVRLFSSSQS
jgi:DNA-binding NarL/FixJ family response regulator